MAAVLGTWNLNKWSWDNIDEMVAETASGNTIPSRWSVSTRKHGITAGDRFFLLKQEVEPRGIVASGTITSLPFEDAHWNNEPGATTNYVNVTIEVVLDPDDVLPLERLQAELGNTHWTP